MESTIKTNPFIKDVILTTLTSIATIFSLIIVLRLLANGLNSERFGAYLLVRRVLSTIEPFSTFGMGIALSRYIAITNDRCLKSKYLLSGVFLGAVSSSAILIMGLLFRKQLTILLFHSDDYASLFVNMLFLIVGYSFYILLYAYYRGSGEMWKANLAQLAVMAIIPVFIAAVFGHCSKVEFIVFLFACTFMMAVIPLLASTFKAFRQTHSISQSKGQFKEIMKYGRSRIPAQFTFGAILMTGPFFAPYFGALKEAGYLVLSQSLLKVVEGGVEGFSRVILPKAAQLLAEGRQEFLKYRMTDMAVFIFQMGLFFTLHLFIWSDEIVLVWLGNQYADAIPLMKVVIISLIPYITYGMFRSVIDAVEEKAVNAFNLYIAFFVALFGSLILARAGLGVMGLAIGMTLGFFVLGALTVVFLWKLCHFEIKAFMFRECLLLNIVLITIVFVLKYYLNSTFGRTGVFAAGAVAEILVLLVYCGILWKLRVRWMLELKERIVPSKSG
jgi:O-antigen/teichoic acid export membrane protein